MRQERQRLRPLSLSLSRVSFSPFALFSCSSISGAKRRSQAVERRKNGAGTLVKATRILRAPIAVLFLHHPISVDRLIARSLPTGTMLSFRSRRYISLAREAAQNEEAKKRVVRKKQSIE